MAMLNARCRSVKQGTIEKHMRQVVDYGGGLLLGDFAARQATHATLTRRCGLVT